MNTKELAEKWQATLKSYEETIDEVVKSSIVHQFPDVKPPRYSSYRTRRNLASASCSSISTAGETIASDLSSQSPLSQSSSYQHITNTISCSHHDAACACATQVRENKNLKGKYARDYREQMFKKSKRDFLEFNGLFRFFDHKKKEKPQKPEEKREYTSLKKERFDFFGLNPNDASDVGYYHHLINDIMKEMDDPCSICFENRFDKVASGVPVNFVTSDCTHVFCTACFKHEKIVSIISLIY